MWIFHSYVELAASWVVDHHPIPLLRMYSRVSYTQHWDRAFFFLSWWCFSPKAVCLRTGQNEDTIRKDLMRDNFMSAEEVGRHRNEYCSLSSVATLALHICAHLLRRRRNTDWSTRSSSWQTPPIWRQAPCASRILGSWTTLWFHQPWLAGKSLK